MTVKGLIAELQKMPKDLVVCMEDWNEEWDYPTEVQIVREAKEKHTTNIGRKEDSFVCLG